MTSLPARCQSYRAPSRPDWGPSLRKGKPIPHEAGTAERTQRRVDRTTQKRIPTLIISMRRRCQETITARGGHTHYLREYISIFDGVLIMLVDLDIVKDTLYLILLWIQLRYQER